MLNAMEIESYSQGPHHHLFDDDGYMKDPEQWSESIAQHLAFIEIGELNKAHWHIIYFVRNRFMRFQSMPPMRRICREFGYEKDAVKGLFGGCRQLWRIAGLPYPGEEAITYMD